MKKRNIFGKKLTQFTRRHKHPITVHRLMYLDTPLVIKEYHGYKTFSYISDENFTTLRDFASPITKDDLRVLINDYTLNPHTCISSWETEVIY